MTPFHRTIHTCFYRKLFDFSKYKRYPKKDTRSFQRQHAKGLTIGQKPWMLLIALLLLPIFGGCVRDLTSGSQGWSGLTEKDGVVYVGTIYGQLLALDSQNGSTIWRYPQDVDGVIGGVFNPPAVTDDQVFVGTQDGTIYALEAGHNNGQGELMWEGFTQGSIVGGPVIAGDKVLVGSEDQQMYAFDMESGEVKWTFMADGKIWSSPTVDESTVYFGSMDGYVYALSLSDGRLVWDYKTDGAVASKPLRIEDKVVVGSFDRSLYALDSRSGEYLWSYKSDNWFWGGVVANDTTIFAPSMDGKIYALDPDTGDLMWLFDCGDAIVSTPLLLEDGLVVASESGLLHFINTDIRDQQELWFYDAGAFVRAPISGADAVVYVGDLDGDVRRVNTTGGRREEWRISTARD